MSSVTYKFDQIGVGASLQHGRRGGHVVWNPTSNVFQVFNTAKDALANLRVAETPLNDNDAASKKYVDALVTGLSPKDPVRVATTQAQILSADFENGDMIDDVILSTGDRVLVKDQLNQADNGIYVVKAIGIPDRALDADSAGDMASAFLFVAEGTTNSNTGWVSTFTSAHTLGVDPNTFVKFSEQNPFTASEGVRLTNSDFQLDIGSLADTAVANGDDFVFYDISSSTSRKRSIGDIIADQDILTTNNIASSLSGDGVSITGSTLGLTVTGLVSTATTGNDTVSFFDDSANDDLVKRTFTDLMNDLQIPNGLTSDGFVVRDGSGVWDTVSILASSVAGLEGVAVTGGNGSANPIIGIDIAGATARTDVVADDDLVLVYNTSTGSNESFTVSDLVNTAITQNNFLTWTGAGNTTGDASLVADGDSDTATFTGGVGVSVAIDGTADSLTFNLVRDGLTNTATQSSDTIPFFDGSNGNAARYRSISNLIDEQDIITSANVANKLTSGNGITISGSTISQSITGLTDAEIATGDAVVFFDDSDSDVAKTRSVANVIADLGLATGGDLSGNRGVSVSASNELNLTLTGLADTVATTTDRMAFFDTSNTDLAKSRSLGNIIGDLDIVTGTVGVATGGTGLTTIAANSLLVANTANTLTAVTAVEGNGNQLVQWNDDSNTFEYTTFGDASGVTFGAISLTGGNVSGSATVTATSASATLSLLGGDGIVMTGVDGTDTVSVGLSKLGLSNTVVDVADVVPFFDTSGNDAPEYRSFGDIVSDLEIVTTSDTGILTQTVAGTTVGRTIAASVGAGEGGIVVDDGDGVSGNPTIGLDLAGLPVVTSLDDDDSFIMFDSGTNQNQQISKTDLVQELLSQVSAPLVQIVEQNFALTDGFVLGTLANGSRVMRVKVYIDTAYDPATTMRIVTSGGEDLMPNVEIDTDLVGLYETDTDYVNVTGSTEEIRIQFVSGTPTVGTGHVIIEYYGDAGLLVGTPAVANNSDLVYFVNTFDTASSITTNDTVLAVEVMDRGARYEEVTETEYNLFPASAKFTTNAGTKFWLLNEVQPSGIMFGAIPGITYDLSTHTVTGTDCSGAMQDWITYHTLKGVDVDEDGASESTYPSGFGNMVWDHMARDYRLSNSIDLTGLRAARNRELNLSISYLYMDCAGQHAFDATGSSDITLDISGIGCAGAIPLSKLVWGRVRDKAAGRMYIFGGSSLGRNAYPTMWVLAEYIDKASELGRMEARYSINNNTTGYAYARDTGAALFHDVPQTISAVTATDPAVFTIATHGFANDDIVVPRNFSGFVPSDSSEFIVAYVVKDVTTDTFTLERVDTTPVDASDYSAWVSGEFCKENYEPSHFHGEDRMEPYTSLSHLATTARNTTFNCPYGTASIYVSDAKHIHFDDCYANGPVAVLIESVNDNGVGADDAVFDIHHENSGGGYDHSYLFRASGADKEITMRGCHFKDATNRAEDGYMGQADGVVSVTLIGSSITTINTVDGYTTMFQPGKTFHCLDVDVLTQDITTVNPTTFYGKVTQALNGDSSVVPAPTQFEVITAGTAVVETNTMRIDAENGDATDDLTDIECPTFWGEGTELIIFAQNENRTINVVGDVGNIRLKTSPVVLDDLFSGLRLVLYDDLWLEV